MTAFAVLLRLCGLSQREAAMLHGVRSDTVKSWAAGRRATPPAVIAELRRLWRSIGAAADRTIEELSVSAGPAQLVYPADDHGAERLGLPCVGAVHLVKNAKRPPGVSRGGAVI